MELVLDAAVDDHDIAGAQPLRLVSHGHRHVALDDPHELLRLRMCVTCDRGPRRVHDMAHERLLSADCVERHTGEQRVAFDAVPRPECGVHSTTSFTGASGCATLASESSSSKATTFPCFVG